MEIICIGHSGFLIKLPKCNLIFDYFTDEKGIITPEVFRKKTFVFVSHRHHDHYSEKIFEWAQWGEVVYVIDSGCPVNNSENIIKVCEGENINIDEINVKTYGSTDEGVSFLVTADGYTVFHAGDLNDWYWEEESTPSELLEDEENYLNIIRKLAGQKIDAAFIPKDPRLKQHAERGICYFKQIVSPEKIIPMHFPGNAGLIY